MYLTESPAYWAVWPQQETNPDQRYGAGDAVGLVTYGRQAGYQGHMQPPAPAPSYITSRPYSGPLPLAATYAPNPNYNTVHPLPGNGSYEDTVTARHPYAARQYDDRHVLPMISTNPHIVGQMSAYPQGAGEPSVHKVESPLMSIKPDPHQSASPVAVSKTREHSPATASDTPQDNPVNNVLRVIQSQTGVKSITNELDSLSVGSQRVVQDQPQPRSTSPTSKTVSQRRASRSASKRHYCDLPGCDKGFAQKAQLTAHIRVHTGEKPYQCQYGCGRSFSQPGNRTTHHRSHTGEAPYQCQICGKRFANRGNLDPHIKTHSGVKEFVCMLDNCGKEISTKGNLKTHQAKYHSATLDALARRLSEVKNPELASEEDRKTLGYLKSVHNNLNKGIKGCRGRKIRRLTSSPESSAPSSPGYNSNDTCYEPYEGHLQPYQQIPVVNVNPAYGFSTTFDLARQTITPQAAVHLDIRMYNSDIDGMTSPPSMHSPSSTATYDGEEEQMIVARHCRF